MIHLDTSFLIQALVPQSVASNKLQQWLISGEELRISSIAWSEFLCGPLTFEALALVENIFSTPEPFLASDAVKAAELFNSTAVARGASRIAKLQQ